MKILIVVILSYVALIISAGLLVLIIIKHTALFPLPKYGHVCDATKGICVIQQIK